MEKTQNFMTHLLPDVQYIHVLLYGNAFIFYNNVTILNGCYKYLIET